MKTELEPKILRFADGTEVSNAEDFRKRRAEMLDILASEEYGYIPEAVGKTEIAFSSAPKSISAGFGLFRTANVFFDTPKGKFTFPIKIYTPDNGKKNPGFVFMNFNFNTFDAYLPVEEIVSNGFSVALIHYNDVTSDNGDMNDKLCGMFDRPSNNTGYGKISIWAFAMSRVMDVIGEIDGFDSENIAAIGHSRLGKTALWAGANDERFKYVISNDSGCGGAASERIKHDNAETIAHMNNVFPYWFCENRKQYADRADEMPFDQHFLVACVAPRFVSVASAEKDAWADPYSEQLTCVNASPAWEVQGLKGYCGSVEPLAIDTSSDEGRVTYHIRKGAHYLSRVDWNYYMKVISNELGR